MDTPNKAHVTAVAAEIVARNADPDIAFAKLKSLSEGALLASN